MPPLPGKNQEAGRRVNGNQDSQDDKQKPNQTMSGLEKIHESKNEHRKCNRKTGYSKSEIILRAICARSS